MLLSILVWLDILITKSTGGRFGTGMSDAYYWEKLGAEYEITLPDIASVRSHRQAVGHRAREICDACPQPITNKIVKYWEGQGVRPRKAKRMGVFN